MKKSKMFRTGKGREVIFYFSYSDVYRFTNESLSSTAASVFVNQASNLILRFVIVRFNIEQHIFLIVKINHCIHFFYLSSIKQILKSYSIKYIKLNQFIKLDIGKYQYNCCIYISLYKTKNKYKF